MKVLWLTDFFPKSEIGEITGGVEARCFYVSHFLKKSGVDLKIIARRTTGSTWHPPSLISIPERIIFTIRSIIEGLKADADLIEGTNFATFPAAWIIAKIKQKPIIFWYPDVFLGSWVENAGPIAGLIGELSEKIILKLPVDKFIAISNQTKEKLISHNVPQEKIAVINCGIEKFNIPKSKIKYDVCAVSRLLPYKRLEDLIKAAEILNIKVAILGRGPDEERLKKMATKKVTFINYLPKHKDVLELIASARVFCHPSIVEGFGISVLEAMSLGKPVVLSDIPVFHETTNGKGVLFFKPKSAQALAAKLKQLLSSKNLYKQKSNQAKQQANLFSWSDIGQQTLDLYKNLTKLKICMTTDAWRPVWGGGQEHVLQVSNRLQENHNCQVDIITPNLNGNKIPDETNVRRVGISFTFPNIIGRLAYLVAILFYQLSHNYDIYHSHGSEAILLPVVKLLKPKAKVVYTVHGAGVKMLGPGIVNLFNLPKKIWEQFVYNYPFDVLMSAAKATVEKSIKAKKFLVTGNGVNIEDFDKVKEKKSKKTFKIIWVGRESDPIKGVKFLKEAFKMLKKRHSNFRLKIVSNRPHDEVIKELKSSDVFVLPSLSEGFPIVLLEAMVAKLPIVTTDVGDAGDPVRKSGAGIVVKSGNTQALAKGIEKLYKNHKGLGEKGYKFVKYKYSWSKIADKVNKIYRSLSMG